MRSLSFGVPTRSAAHLPGIHLHPWDAPKGRDVGAGGGRRQERHAQKLREATQGKF